MRLSVGILTTAVILSLTVLSCSKTHGTSEENSDFPSFPRGQLKGENNFAHLISRYSRGQPKRAPWTGYWWPYLEEGISEAAEKYELATEKRGALAWEFSHHGAETPGVQSWWGHCNGWSAASVLFPEPKAPIARNGIAFSEGDQKALLSEIGQEVSADFFGLRDDTDDPSSPSFQDIFPNQFFLVLTNVVGKGHSLIMDRYTGAQVWNQPIAGYEIAPITPEDDLGTDPSAPDVYRVMVNTQVWWLRDDVAPDQRTDSFEFENGPSFDSRLLRYEVWLDGPLRFNGAGKLIGSGNVILSRKEELVYGGAWRMGESDRMNSHPDYVWIPYAVVNSTGTSNPEINPSLVKSLIGF